MGVYAMLLQPCLIKPPSRANREVTCGGLRQWGPLGRRPTMVVGCPGPVAHRPLLWLGD